MKYNIAIIGCGLVAQKRASNLPDNCRLVAVYDLKQHKAQLLASKHLDCKVFSSREALLASTDIDIVIVSTVHAALAQIALAAIKSSKHVLLEKPGAISVKEIEYLLEAQAQYKVCLRLGFNHRYHPALIKAKQLVDSGALGELYYVRGFYGHGGRIGYQHEWRMNKSLAGAGQLIDQGMHLIDLSRWFLGEFTMVNGQTHRYFWQSEVEDNAFLHLETANGQTAFLHSSLTEWKNRFSFEIIGREGKCDIFGLGGSYGTEKLTYYKMLPQMGPPQTTIWEYPFEDNSWRLEFEDFVQDIIEQRLSKPGLIDAKQALIIVEKVLA